MANQFVVPFDQNPYSVSVKTTSYTVPSGYYARVVVSSFEEDFTIDSVIAVEKTHVSATTGGSISNAVEYTNTSSYTMICIIKKLTGNSRSLFATITGGTTTNFVFANINKDSAISNGTANYMATAQYGTTVITLMPDMVIYGSGNDSGATSHFEMTAQNPPTEQIFWVPTGTDLDGSRYIVELYTEVS